MKRCKVKATTLLPQKWQHGDRNKWVTEVGREVKQKCLPQNEVAGTTMLRVKVGLGNTWEYKTLWVRQ